MYPNARDIVYDLRTHSMLSGQVFLSNLSQHLDGVYKFMVLSIRQIQPLAVVHLDVSGRCSDRSFLVILIPIVPPNEAEVKHADCPADFNSALVGYYSFA